MARNSFTPSAPNQIIWVIAIIVGILGLLAPYLSVAVLSTNSFWLVAAGFILLAVGTTFKGI